MPRKRSKQNEGLPARWRHVHNAYYYQVPPGLESLWDGKKTFRLGTKLNEAYKVWADRIARPTDCKTIGQLLDLYVIRVIPGKAAASQTGNHAQVKVLRRVFGDSPLLPFTPQIVYQYIERRSVKKKNDAGRTVGGKVAALREVELLSHAYTKAVEWGFIDRHPFLDQVRVEGSVKPRTRYVEDWEIIEALSLESRRKAGSVLMVQAYLRLKLLTGMAQGDLLRLQESHLKPDGIYNMRHKTENSSGVSTLYEWTDQLREAVAMAQHARTNRYSQFLFCNRKGEAT